MTLCAKGPAVVYVILQLRIFLSVFDVVRCGRSDRQAVLIGAAVALALFAQIPRAPKHRLTPSPVTRSVVIRICCHAHHLRLNHKPSKLQNTARKKAAIIRRSYLYRCPSSRRSQHNFSGFYPFQRSATRRTQNSHILNNGRPQFHGESIAHA